MKKIIVFLCFLISLSRSYSYEYLSSEFYISGNKIESVNSDNKASVTGNTLNTVYQGKNYSKEVKNISNVITNDSIVDYFTNLALEETSLNINNNGVFSAGANWPTAWTRDMSYAINLSLSFLFPKTVEASLAKRVENNFILQDTGSGGSYPVSTDRVVWALAAYDYSLVKQDIEYSRWVFNVISKTINYDYNVNYSKEKKLFKGETSFIDWREQSYPRWMDSIYIAESYSLGTNVVYYSAMKKAENLAYKIGDEKSALLWNKRATELKESILSNFWINEKGYFGSYIISNVEDYLYEGYETLGESISIIDDIADSSNFGSIVNAIKPGPFGLSVFAPQLFNIPPYHNDAVWPFVQAYRGLAAKKANDAKVCEDEFASILYSAAMFRTLKENYVASTGLPNTLTNSDRQLWSDAGFLAYIYKIICGLDLSDNGIKISPLIFDSFKNGIIANNISIGNTIINLKIKGNGDLVTKFKVNGKNVPVDYIIPYNSGIANIEINVKKSEKYISSYKNFNERKYNFDAFAIQKAIPLSSIYVEKNKGEISWKQKNKDGFDIMKNGLKIDSTNTRDFSIKISEGVDFYTVSSIDIDDIPVLYGNFVRSESRKNTTLIEAENTVFVGGSLIQEDSMEPTKSKDSYNLEKVVSNYGKYIEKWGSTEGDSISFSYKAKKDGYYIVDFRFKNGHGPINTGEKCAIRALYSDNELIRRLSFPQLGSWSVWAFSAPIKVYLKKGTHLFTLKSDEFCYSQHNKINYIDLDLIRISYYK